MTAVLAAVLFAGVAASWLGALALFRLTPLGRIHALGFVNVVAGGLLTVAAWVSDGLTSRSLKVSLIWLVLMFSGALSAHVTGRAVNLRGGERR